MINFCGSVSEDAVSSAMTVHASAGIPTLNSSFSNASFRVVLINRPDFSFSRLIWDFVVGVPSYPTVSLSIARSISSENLSRVMINILIQSKSLSKAHPQVC